MIDKNSKLQGTKGTIRSIEGFVEVLVLTVLAAILPGRILTVETEGNVSVPTRYILEQAEDCGLKFWSRRRDIRSEQIKNALLERIPQLQWVGVNTYGCRAVIAVRERSAVQENQIPHSISHFVAAREGVISACTVTRGSSNCTVGQAVRTGDILISGYTDCGITYTADRAEGEILARTKRELCLIAPASCRIQTATDRSATRFSLLIGKKRINFSKGSGIYGGTCDKMYSKYVLTLPGGFRLPVSLLKETAVDAVLTDLTLDQAPSVLETYGSDYLTEHMNNGIILRKSEQTAKTDGVFCMIGLYDCQENIGIVQEEKIGDFNGKTDGTDRQRGSGG